MRLKLTKFLSDPSVFIFLSSLCSKNLNLLFFPNISLLCIAISCNQLFSNHKIMSADCFKVHAKIYCELLSWGIQLLKQGRKEVEWGWKKAQEGQPWPPPLPLACSLTSPPLALGPTTLLKSCPSSKVGRRDGNTAQSTFSNQLSYFQTLLNTKAWLGGFKSRM